jgi:hypothetical protein
MHISSVSGTHQTHEWTCQIAGRHSYCHVYSIYAQWVSQWHIHIQIACISQLLAHIVCKVKPYMLQISQTDSWRAHGLFVDTSCRYITKYLAILETPLHLIQNQEMSINTIINGRDIISESYQILHLSLCDGWDWILSKISIIIWWSKPRCSGKAWRYILHWRCRQCAASGCHHVGATIDGC